MRLIRQLIWCRNFSSALTELLVTMPKEKPHAAVLKSQRLKGKAKNDRYAAGGIVSLHVLGSGAVGAPRALYVFTDRARYLFNCGEGTQRLAHEHKMKLSKLEHVFITRCSWDNIGGLPGVALTIQDVGVPSLTLHSPPNLDKIFSVTRRFIILKDLEVRTVDCSEGGCFEDAVMSVKYIPLFYNRSPTKPLHPSFQSSSPTRGGTFGTRAGDDTIDYYAHERRRKTSKERGSRREEEESSEKTTNSLKRKRSSSPATLSSEGGANGSWFEGGDDKKECSLVYVCRLHDRPGALCLEKCVEHGVPPGPLLGRLKAGEDIVLDCGRVVRSKDVTLPPDKGHTFIVMEVANEEALESLVSEETQSQLKDYQVGGSDTACIVVHFTPSHILAHPKYVDFMNKFQPSCYHLVINEENNCKGSTAVHRLQYKLNMLDSVLFPLLPENHFQATSTLNLKESGLRLIHADTLCKITLRPQISLEKGNLCLERDEYRTEVEQMDGWVEERDKLVLAQDSLPPVSHPSASYPEIIFLGTGSCIPNKTRNTSGILVNLSEDRSMILDCGEGTWGQLVRFYGIKGAHSVLRRLKGIYVSHLHADHHIGLLGLLKAWQASVNPSTPPLCLMAPGQICPWLALYHNTFEDLLSNVQLVPNAYLREGSERESERDLVKEGVGLRNVVTCSVIHCPNAFGVALTTDSGRKISYSGDTMPCDNLVHIGEGSDVLIHEATMEDDLADEAKVKLHSTTGQAVEIGKRTGASYTLLTHFSQRYAKLPRLESSVPDTVCIAFDNMRVGLGEMNRIPLMYEALRLIFQEDCDELEAKALKRKMKLEASSRSPSQLSLNQETQQQSASIAASAL